MLRTRIIQSARILAQPRVYARPLRPLVAVRFETTEAPSSESKPSHRQVFKAAQELNDNLQRDWDAKELTYEELKPRTNSPTTVSIHTLLSSVIHDRAVGHVPDRCP